MGETTTTMDSTSERSGSVPAGSDLAGKRILVTGGSGFLGRAVLRSLVDHGADDLVAPRAVEFDLTDPDAVERLFQVSNPEIVIHLAARVGGIGANQASPGDLYLDNLLMGTYVIDAARRAEIAKTVVVGTICSYPKMTPVPFSEDSLWTGFPEETNAPYGIAKLALLMQLQANRDQFGQQGIYLMPTNLYGPGDKFHPGVSHVIPALIRKCVLAKEAGAEHIDVWGTGQASREFLYVDEAAEGVVLATMNYEDPDPVNLGTNHEVYIRDLVPLVAELVGFDGEIRWDSSKPDGQPRRGVDPSRAQKAFGFEASMDLRQGLERTITWYLENRHEAEARER